MTKLQEYKLGDISDVTKLAGFEYTKYITYIEDGETIALRALNVRDGILDLTDVKRIKKEVSDSLIRSKLYKYDILFTYVGANIGQFALVPEDDKFHLAPNICRIRCNDKCNPYFLYNYFRTKTFKESLEGFSHGSSQPTMPMSTIRQIPISLPSIPEQTAIAEVLSGIDDKIDLLHRQNKTLEQLAETLFRQWFVESEKIEVKSEKLGDVIKTTSGGTPSRNKMEYYSNGVYRWVKSKELSGSFIFETEEKITEDALKNSSAKILPASSILIAMYGATVGEFGILANESTCNQAICALIPNENYPYTYLFLLTKTNKDNLLNLAVGSAQQNISQVLIKEMEVCGDKQLLRKFHEMVEPYFQKIKSNTQQIRTLTQLRDTQLPKLMSGEVSVR